MKCSQPRQNFTRGVNVKRSLLLPLNIPRSKLKSVKELTGALKIECFRLAAIKHEKAGLYLLTSRKVKKGPPPCPLGQTLPLRAPTL
jgi:hypothetical protein